MRDSFRTWLRVLLAGALALALIPPASARKGKHPTDLTEILSDMNEASKRLKTVSANLEYTKFTELVNDKSTESGQLFYRKGKTTEIRIDIQKPERKILLFKKNKGEMYLPKINQIQEYNLEQKSDLVQQFLLLGFGTDSGELKKAYNVTYLKEEELEGDTTVVLELSPRKGDAGGQISRIQLWVNEESWLPAQQKFFESGGDYLIARYSGVKVNRILPGSTFELDAGSDAKRVKMN
ncbi:MAG TPA: outer membrane lipoprotein-sorting protein [Terriglobia bacterium]|nr:outer membrane lipoprotein-sorting protein [Terriglobia bacterium]